MSTLDLRNDDFNPTARELAAAILRALGAAPEDHESTDRCVARAIAVAKSQGVESICLDHRYPGGHGNETARAEWGAVLRDLGASGLAVEFKAPLETWHPRTAR